MKLPKALTMIVSLYIALGYIAHVECMSREDMYEVLPERMRFAPADLECRNRGFDGLAVVSSPEEYNYALAITVSERKTLGVWVGLIYDVDLNKLVWLDGSDLAPDMPWVSSQKNGTARYACSRIRIDGALGMVSCKELKYAVCGYHTGRFLEATGSTHPSTLPASITSSIANVNVMSYLQCTLLCGGQHKCRAAWFDKQSSTCMLLGSGGYTGLENRQDSQMFIRTEYELP